MEWIYGVIWGVQGVVLTRFPADFRLFGLFSGCFRAVFIPKKAGLWPIISLFEAQQGGFRSILGLGRPFGLTWFGGFAIMR